MSNATARVELPNVTALCDAQMALIDRCQAFVRIIDALEAADADTTDDIRLTQDLLTDEQHNAEHARINLETVAERVVEAVVVPPGEPTPQGGGFVDAYVAAAKAKEQANGHSKPATEATAA